MATMKISGYLARELVHGGDQVCPTHPETLCGCPPFLQWRKIETVEGDSRRWQQHMETVVLRPDNTYWVIQWENGLTENQDNTWPWENYMVPSELKDVEIHQVRPVAVETTSWVDV